MTLLRAIYCHVVVFVVKSSIAFDIKINGALPLGIAGSIRLTALPKADSSHTMSVAYRKTKCRSRI